MKKRIEKKLVLSTVKIGRLSEPHKSNLQAAFEACPSGQKTCYDICGTGAATIYSCNTTITQTLV
jgi:hypothetical protein